MAIVSILMLNRYDPTIWDGMILPKPADLPADLPLISNPPVLNKQDLIDLMCYRLAELSLVYSEPENLKEMIRIWSNTRFYTWLHLYETLCYKYNPIWNKDGSYVEERDLSKADQASGSGSSTGNRYDDITGFDSNSYAPNTRTRSDASNSQNASSSGTEHEKIKRTEQGNIGLVMSQEMVEAERQVVQFNLYDYICEEFRREFCISIY